MIELFRQTWLREPTVRIALGDFDMIRAWLLASMALATSAEGLPASTSLEAGPKAANNRLWISNADFPPELQKKGASGAVRILYSVDETGIVFRCDVERSSGVPLLDEAACNAIKKHGLFIPARDSNGRNIASRLARVISYFPGGQPLTISPEFSSDRAYNVRSLPNNKTFLATGIRQIIGADGKVESCSIENSSGIEAVDEKVCELGNDLDGDGPMRDRDGNPVRSMRFSNIALIVPPHP